MNWSLFLAIISLSFCGYLLYQNKKLKQEGVRQLQTEEVREICRQETALLRILVEENPHAYRSRIDAAVEHLQKGCPDEDVLKIIDLVSKSQEVGVCDEEAAFRLKALYPYCDGERSAKRLARKLDKEGVPVSFPSSLLESTNSS